VETGISGIPRSREWDAVASTECAATGTEAVFVVLPQGQRIQLSGDEEAARCAAEALEGELGPPYRALAVRREGTTWAVGAVSIEVVELPADTEGDKLMLTVTEEGERALEVDGRRTVADLEALAAVAAGRFDAYVLRATRLEDNLWEVGVNPL
jgi:hypothetical protein